MGAQARKEESKAPEKKNHKKYIYTGKFDLGG